MASFGDFLSFLTNGQPPINVPATGQKNTELPPWYNDYTQGLLSKANQWANEPYTPYTGPRVAPVDPLTDQAVSTIQNTIPQTGAYYGAAADMFGKGTSGSALSAANPYFSAAAGMGGGADFGASNALATAGANAPGGLPLAQPLIDKATNQSALSNAMPFVRNASGQWPDEFSKYMSPYTGQVVDEMGRLSNRNLTERLLPALNDTFIRSGGTRGGMNSNLGTSSERLGRDVAADLLGQQAGALEAGYKTSADIFGSDKNRQTQLAQITGNLTAADMEALIKGGATLGDLAEAGAQRKISGAGVLGSNAASAGNLALGAQRNMIDIGANVGQLSSGDLNRYIAGGQGLGNLATDVSNTGIKTAGALSDLGSIFTANKQNNLDTAYGDFKAQRDWPVTSSGVALDLANKVKLPESGTTYTYGPADMYGSSPLAQLGSLGLTWGAISDMLNNKKDSSGGTDYSAVMGYLKDILAKNQTAPVKT